MVKVESPDSYERKGLLFCLLCKNQHDMVFEKHTCIHLFGAHIAGFDKTNKATRSPEISRGQVQKLYNTTIFVIPVYILDIDSHCP